MFKRTKFIGHKKNLHAQELQNAVLNSTACDSTGHVTSKTYQLNAEDNILFHKHLINGCLKHPMEVLFRLSKSWHVIGWRVEAALLAWQRPNRLGHVVYTVASFLLPVCACTSPLVSLRLLSQGLG